MTPFSPTETARLSVRDETADCAPCAARITDALQTLPGVQAAFVDPLSRRVTVRFEPGSVGQNALEACVAQTEQHLAQSFSHHVFAVRGMDCPGCAQTLQAAVEKLPGVVSASCEFTSARLLVEQRVEQNGASSATVSEGAVKARAKTLGFILHDTDAGANGEAFDEAQKRPFWRTGWARVGASAVLLVLGLLLEYGFSAPEWMAKAALGGSLVLGGGRFALAGLSALRARVLGTNLLMALAAVGALFIGHWEEAATVVVLYTLGEALEGAAMEKTRRALSGLIGAAPQTVVLQADNHTETVPISAVKIGDVMLLAPGASAAADGTVVSGASAVSEAAVTGESVPRDKEAGDAIYAGSLNGNGPLLVRVDALPENSTLSRLVRLTERAQAEKAPTQTVVEKFGRVYTPLVLCAAALLMLIGPFFAPQINWIYRSLTLLVVACPCALLIATPVAYVSALARAARAGVLVKGGAHLENLAQAKTVFLDKTGTLTTGDLRVFDIWAATAGDEAHLLQNAADLERYSEHPIARAIVCRAEAVPETYAAAHYSDVKAVPGRGITARNAAGALVLMGNWALLSDNEIALSLEAQNRADAWEAGGKTVLFVAQNNAVRGAISVGDTVRPEAARVVSELHRQKKQTHILTGDNARAAQNAARETGANAWSANLLPHQKQQVVQTADDENAHPVFVGDGINDAPALASASVGISLNGSGTALALETADVVLMDGTLSHLPWIFSLAKSTRAVVRVNVGIAVGTACVLLIAAATGKMNLTLGVLGHEGTALLVIANGARLLWKR